MTLEEILKAIDTLPEEDKAKVKAKVQDLDKAEDEREIDKIEEDKAETPEVADEKKEEVKEESDEIGKTVDELKEEVTVDTDKEEEEEGEETAPTEETETSEELAPETAELNEEPMTEENAEEVVEEEGEKTVTDEATKENVGNMVTDRQLKHAEGISAGKYPVTVASKEETALVNKAVGLSSGDVLKVSGSKFTSYIPEKGMQVTYSKGGTLQGTVNTILANKARKEAQTYGKEKKQDEQCKSQRL